MNCMYCLQNQLQFAFVTRIDKNIQTDTMYTDLHHFVSEIYVRFR